MLAATPLSPSRSAMVKSTSSPPMPRRAKASVSVSLVHTPQDVGPRCESDKVFTKSDNLSSSSKPAGASKDDSGESSNADRWFDRSNHHAFVTSPGYVNRMCYVAT